MEDLKASLFLNNVSDLVVACPTLNPMSQKIPRHSLMIKPKRLKPSRTVKLVKISVNIRSSQI